MVYLTRAEHFNAAHKLYNPSWSKEKNDEVFGKCANDNWHGHNYELFVTVKGDPDPDTGFLVDAKKLSIIINQHVIEKLDHRNLNLDVDFMQDKLSTTEVLAEEIWKQIEKPINALGCKLHCVKVQETEKNYVEYFGE